jgi:hypothetical protein
MHHVLEKGFQAGSVIGVALVVPAVAWRRGRSAGTLAGAGPALLKALGTSALVGTGVAGALGVAMIASIPSDERAAGLQDRAYRLHWNRAQNRTDLFSEVGMALGGTAALFVSPAAAVVVGGAAAGSAVGVLLHTATRAAE